jgi:dephospho-CoA kinase
MKVIGVTGGIASGKSLISDWFVKAQINVIDADKVYKTLMKNDQSLYEEVMNHFDLPASEDHKLDYRALGNIVFNDKKKLDELNRMTHPYVIKKTEEIIESHRQNNEKHLVLDIPLLFESKMDVYCDVVICVYVDKETQIERLMKRNLMDRKTAISRIDSQMDLEEKKEKSTFVIDNSLSKDHSYRQFRQILAKINQM